MYPIIRRMFSEYPFYDRLRYRRKINQIARGNPAVFRQRLSRQREKEIVTYWRAYGVRVNLAWHRALHVVHPCDDVHRYIPEDIFFACMERKLNRFELAEAYTDKNCYDRLFRREATPTVLFRQINHRFYDADYRLLEPADIMAKIARASGDFIVKPSIASGGGTGVQRLRIDRGKLTAGGEGLDLSRLASPYNGDFLVQEVFEQHPAIAEFHPYSVNTTRILTFRLDAEICVASAVLRLGNCGRPVDNGGIPCGVRPDGGLNEQAVTKFYVKHDVHPYTKKPFRGFVVPGWEAACSFVQRLHVELPYFDIVSWDIAIGPDEKPTLIEFNLTYQDIAFLQINNGPLFGDRTEEMLARVFHDRTALCSLPRRGPECSARHGPGLLDETMTSGANN